MPRDPKLVPGRVHNNQEPLGCSGCVQPGPPTLHFSLHVLPTHQAQPTVPWVPHLSACFPARLVLGLGTSGPTSTPGLPTKTPHVFCALTPSLSQPRHQASTGREEKGLPKNQAHPPPHQSQVLCQAQWAGHSRALCS